MVWRVDCSGYWRFKPPQLLLLTTLRFATKIYESIENDFFVKNKRYNQKLDAHFGHRVCSSFRNAAFLTDRPLRHCVAAN